MINFLSIVFCLVVADLALMPMFHIGGLPYKPSFLLVGVFFIFNWYRKQTLDVLFMFLGLIVSCWIGAIYQAALYEVASYSFTIYCTTSYFLCFIGYMYSYYYSPNNIDNVVGITFVALLMTIVIGVFFDKVPLLINFYHLQEEMAAGWVSVRNPGMFENPNISSLGINLLLLFIISAYSRGYLGNYTNIRMGILLVSVLVALLTLGSKGELIAFLILITFFLRTNGVLSFSNITRNYLMIISLFSILGLFFFVGSQLSSRYPESSFRNGFYFATSGINELYGEYVMQDVNMENRGDRRVKYLLAFKAFSHSPLIGSGFDRAERGIFSKESKIGYHSDWSYLLVAGGIFAFAFFLLILFRVWRTHPLLVLPFFIPGLTNSFMLAPQFFCLFGVFWGYLERRRKNEKQL